MTQTAGRYQQYLEGLRVLRRPKNSGRTIKEKLAFFKEEVERNRKLKEKEAAENDGEKTDNDKHSQGAE